MFSCKFCNKKYNTTQGLGNHIKYCDLNPSKKIYLQKIHKECYCQYCNKYYNNENSLHQHEIRCKYNSNRLLNFDNFKNYRKTKGCWNKGLTKDVSISLQKASNTLKTNIAKGIVIPAFKGKHHSNETKIKISKALLAADHSNKDRFSHGHKGYFDNIFFMSTYELAYYIYMKDTGHQIERCKQRFKYEYNGKMHYYTPDFIVDGNIVEIKGYERDIDLVKYKSVENLIVLYKADLDIAIDYVKQKFCVVDLSVLYTNR